MCHDYHQSWSPGPHPQDLFPLTLTEGWKGLMTFIEITLMLEARPTGQPPNSKHCVYYTSCSPLSENPYLPFPPLPYVATLVYFIMNKPIERMISGWASKIYMCAHPPDLLLMQTNMWPESPHRSAAQWLPHFQIQRCPHLSPTNIFSPVDWTCEH